MDVPTLYPPLVTLPPKRKPIFLGKAIAGANVKVCRTNNADDILAETTADTNGSWLVRSNKELPFGKNSISAYYDKKKGYAPNLEFYIEAPVVVQGNQLQPADIIESPAISYLLPAGSAPIILSPQSGMTLPSPSFIISGQAPANTSVRLFTQDNTDLGVANADEKGDWSAPIELALTTRDVAIKAAIFTTNGSQASAWSMNSLFQIQSVFFSIDGFFNKLFSMDEDSSLPSGSAPQLTSPTTVNSLRPLLTGKAAANAIVHVYLAGGSVLFGKPQADGNGDWQLQLSQDISPGSTSLALAEFNANGGQVSGWTSVTLTTNATPTGTALPYGSVPIIDEPKVGQPITTLRPTFKGRAAPNTEIRIAKDDWSFNIKPIKVDAQGFWQIQAPVDMPVASDGSIGLLTAQYDGQNYAGAMASAWSEPYRFTVKSQTPPVQNTLPYGSVPIIDEPKVGQPITTLRPTFKGRAAPNTEIRIAKDDWSFNIKPIKVDAQGFWQIQAPVDLPVASDGTIGLLTAQYEGQNYAGAMASAWSEPYRFTVKSQTPPVQNTLPYGSVPIIDEPAPGQSITTLRPTFKGRAAPNTEIRIAKDDWSFNIKPIKVDAQGFWQIQAPVDLPVASDGTIGLLTAQYEGQNYAGAMASAWSEPYRFTVKSQTPPVQNTLPYGSVPIIDEPAPGQSITTLRPTFKGRAAPNTEIRIAKDDWSFNIKPIKVDAQGFWQIQPPVDLPVASDGTIGLLTAQYDGQNYAGAMASAWSEPYRFTVERQTPPVQNYPPYTRHYNGTPDPSVERARVGNWYMHSDRQSTGLYLAPGAQMQLDVQLNNAMGNAQVSAVIGMPFTNPNVNSGWYPKVNAYPLSAGANIVSDPEGGMVYVVLQGQGNSAAITFNTGILAAPFFEYGKTSIQQYREMIRTSTQVPYTELVSSRVTLTAEREIVASLLLDDPNTLLETLETIIAIQEHTLGLDGSSPLHTSPALKFHLTYGNYHGAGGAHTFDFYTTYAYPQIFSVEGLKSTFWIGHELGHPLQMIGYLAYPELVESTNNIGAQAVQRHFGAPSVLLAPDASGKSDWDRALEKIKLPGLVFSQLQHFEQLVMFEQLRLAFGDDFWPRVNKVTRERFHQLGPPTDGRYLLKWDAAIDNLILFSSIATGYDLRSYFSQWALQATAQGNQNVANLGLPPPPFDPTTIRA